MKEIVTCKAEVERERNRKITIEKAIGNSSHPGFDVRIVIVTDVINRKYRTIFL